MIEKNYKVHCICVDQCTIHKLYTHNIKHIHVHVISFLKYIYRMLNEDMREKESKISEMLRQNLKLSSQVKKFYWYNVRFQIHKKEICNSLND